MRKAPDAGQIARLQRLPAMPDEEIDTSDMPVMADWSRATYPAM
jgi:hypothetical protein